MDLKSSIVIFSSTLFVSIPRSFKIKLVETDNRKTKGFVILAKISIVPTANRENFSAWFKATLLGTSSPKTKVKKDNKIVIIIIANLSEYNIPWLSKN